mgnify:CR=1 FL=1
MPKKKSERTGKNPFVRFNLKCPRTLWEEFKQSLSKEKNINEHLLEMFQERVTKFKETFPDCTSNRIISTHDI